MEPQKRDIVAPTTVHLVLHPHEEEVAGKLKVYCFHDFSSCGFYRCWLPALYLKKMGLAEFRTSYLDDEKLEGDVTLSPAFRASPSYGEMKHQQVMEGIAWADVVVLQRMAEHGGLALIEMCRQLGKPVIHEVDDMCEEVIPGNPAYWYWRDKDRLERHAESFRRSDFVTTTNSRLAKFYAERYGRPTAVIPSCIDYGSSRWKDISLEKGPGVVVGWMASESHVVDEAQIKEVVSRMLQEMPEVRLEFCGYMPSWASELPRTVLVRGDITTVPGLIKHWDIGLCPIIDHPFNTIGKSDIKFLEYSMVYCVTVAPNLEPYRSSITNNSTGILVRHDDPEDWLRGIRKLVKRRHFREQVANNAHAWVKERRIMQTSGISWFRLFAALAKKVSPRGLEIY